MWLQSSIHILRGTIRVTGAGADAGAREGEKRQVLKKVTFKNCAPFINCINEINNMQEDNAKDLDIVIPMYNLIEYCNNYA